MGVVGGRLVGQGAWRWLAELVTNLANRHGWSFHVACSVLHVLLACMAYTQYAQINVNLDAPAPTLAPTPVSFILLVEFCS